MIYNIQKFITFSLKLEIDLSRYVIIKQLPHTNCLHYSPVLVMGLKSEHQKISKILK